ncbi:MAG TPA: hypothetical protein VMT63_09010 [Bacteroidales bacterium]|nr:hypothetical protein [Bacteroidales bacterium]
MKKFTSLALLIMLSAGFFWGCQKKGDPPALPPAESMTIDFSNFTAKKSALVARAVENTNWTVAATVAGVWNSILLLNLAIPVATFGKAVSYSPSYLDNKTWQWKYSIQSVGVTYNARLTGQIRATDVLWNMYVSKEGADAYSEFLWFTGTTASDGSSGQWTINESQANQVPMLQIDWTQNSGSVTTIKYTWVMTGQTFTGSYIEYGLTSNTLNAYYTIHAYVATKEKFVDVSIEWSTTTHNGRIKAVDFFQDELWHCWDGNGNDIDCTK